MKLVNAEIKTAEELAQRILNGEKLFNKEGRELKFKADGVQFVWLSEGVVDVTTMPDSNKKNALARNVMVDEWNEPHTIQRPAEWYELTDKPTPCFVLNNIESPKNIIRLVCKKERGYYIDSEHGHWSIAVPLTPKELFNGDKNA